MGAFLLGAAGLLKGRRAATHWAYVDLLPLVGATHEKARVARHRMTRWATSGHCSIPFACMEFGGNWRYHGVGVLLMERRLAAILIADIVGYSRLMGLDEEG